MIERAPSCIPVAHLVDFVDHFDMHGHGQEIAMIVLLTLCAGSGLTKLDSTAISKVNTYMQGNKYTDVSLVRFEELLKAFLESGKDAWLPVMVFVAVLQGIAVTMFEDGVILYGTKEP
ncbi:unnamed protein product, partial [Rotaria magnacalcarata]